MNKNTLTAFKTKENFIKKIAPMVQEVFCDSRGVNPSVVIAQAILESGYGTSHLAKKNNIFGLNNYHDGYLINEPFGKIPRLAFNHSIQLFLSCVLL